MQSVQSADVKPQPLATSAADDIEAQRPHGPGAPDKPCCTYLRFMKAMKWIGVLSTIGVMALTFLSLSAAVSPDPQEVTGDNGETIYVQIEVWTVAGVVGIIFLGFQLALSVLMFLGWFELGFVLAHFPILEGWVGLGMMLLYLSISALTTLNCTVMYHNNKAAMAVCFVLAIEGIFFTVAGCCGGKKVTQRAQRMAEEASA